MEMVLKRSEDRSMKLERLLILDLLALIGNIRTNTIGHKTVLSFVDEVLRATSDFRLQTSDKINIPIKIPVEPKILFDFNKVIHRLVA